MSMEKPVAIIELSNTSIKLLVGYELNGKVYSLFQSTKQLGKIKEKDLFLDPQQVISELLPLREFTDDALKLKLKISEAVVILPPKGLQVFETNQVTPVVDDSGRVDSIDIRTLFTQIQKNRYGYSAQTSEIIDIIPERYILDEGRTYTKMPIGEITTSLTLMAKVHVLPIDIVEDNTKVIEATGMKVKRMIASPYASVELIGTYKDMPLDYFLVDMGACETSVSLIGNKQLFKSVIIPFGGDDITHKIQETFTLTKDEAERIKCHYGLNDRKMNFEAPVSIFSDEDGHQVKHTEKELTELIKKELDHFVILLNEAIDSLLESENAQYKSLPMVLIGGGSLLRGLVDYLEPKVQSQTVQVFIPKTFGCRNPSLVSLLGAVYSQGQEKILLNKDVPNVGQVTRVKK